MERKAYLINHSFRFHMGASIMTMTAMNLNSIIDGILMGRLLGSDAFSAINVVIPIVNCISAIGILLSQGAAMQMAKHLGAMEKERANQVLSVSMLSMLIVGIVISYIAAVTGLAQPVVGLLCVARDLFDLAHKYASVLMVGAIFLIFENGTSMLVDVMGNPRIVTVGTIAKTGTNLLFDIVNIKVFGMDIGGAALATLFGSLVGNAIYLFYIYKKSGMKFTVCPKWSSDLMTGLANALPGFLGQLGSVALMFICNYFIMANRGSDGMFVMSIGYTIVSIGSIISNGVGVSYTAIGGMLLGQEDYYGLRALFKKGIFVTVLAPLIFSIGGLFGRYMSLMFGADTPEKIALTQRGLPMICTMLFALGIISSMVYLHTVLGHQTISSVNTLLLLLMIVISFLTVQHLLPPDRIWLAFPLTTILSLSVFLADTAIISVRSKGKLQMVSLIPKTQSQEKILDISVKCNMEEKSSAIDTLIGFLNENGAGELENSIIHCLDELMMNIVSYSGCGSNAYMDLTVMIHENKVTVSLRNAGIPFDPVTYSEKERKSGLKMVFHFCTRLEYRYSFGLNMVLGSWDLNSISNTE